MLCWYGLVVFVFVCVSKKKHFLTRFLRSYVHSRISFILLPFIFSPSSLLSLVNPLIINLRISSKRPISLIYCNSYMNYIPSCGSIESCARKSFVDMLHIMKLLKIFFTVWIFIIYFFCFIVRWLLQFSFLLFIVKISYK